MLCAPELRSCPERPAFPPQMITRLPVHTDVGLMRPAATFLSAIAPQVPPFGPASQEPPSANVVKHESPPHPPHTMNCEPFHTPVCFCLPAGAPVCVIAAHAPPPAGAGSNAPPVSSCLPPSKPPHTSIS